MANPDLVERFVNNWPMNPPVGPANWYHGEAAGYTDLPRYQSTI
jgi:N-ethylmaleimide reductase